MFYWPHLRFRLGQTGVHRTVAVARHGVLETDTVVEWSGLLVTETILVTTLH